MDYEKKYNEALKWMRELYPGLHGATKEDAEHYFPELRESEDERVRKWLVDYFSSIKETVWIHRDITCGQILAWLEKQKEQEHICDSAQYEEGFKTGLEIGSRKQKEQKSAEWSEEDQLNLNWVIAILNGEPCDLDIQLESLISWLKSLRPSWKPNEEQMDALQHAIDACESEWDYQDDELRSLLNDIKKL